MASPQTLLWSARQLWAEAPRWRWTVTGAVLCTIGYVLAGSPQQGGGSTVPSPNPGPVNQQSQPANQGGGGGRPQNSSSSVATPVSPQEIEAGERLSAFYQIADDAPQDKGARCDVLVAAAARLRPADARFAFPAQQAKMAEADACRAPLAVSDARVKAVAAEFAGYGKAPTAAAARRIVEASRGLDDFDLSRKPPTLGWTPRNVADMQAAVAGLDGILARAAPVAPLFRKGDPASLDAAATLAALAPEIASLPFAASLRDTSTPEGAALDAVWAAKAELAEADRRVAVVQTALKRAETDPKGLAQALSALTPFDRARAAATNVDISAAQSAARAVIPSVFQPVVARYLPVGERTREDAEMLVGLARISEELGATLEPGTAAMVAVARADIAGSQERLRRLAAAAAAWRQQRGIGTRNPEVERQVRDILQLLTRGTGQFATFDARAADAADRAALETLRQAQTEIDARIAPGFPRQSLRVAVDIASGAGGQYGAPLRSALTSEIGQVYTAPGNPTEAMLVLVVTDLAIRQVGSGVNARAGIGVEVKGRLTWAYSGASVELAAATGQASDTDPARAVNEALRLAAAQLLRSADAKF